MPLMFFKCPDGEKRLVSDCLNKCPRKEGRCLSLPTLHEAGYSRPFTKPSITQCLNPTRMEYLKIVHDYAIDPVDRAFALLGTRVHRKLELTAKLIDKVISEHKVEDSDTIGTLDLLEPDELHEGYYKLVDMKTWGSYACAKVLGRKDNGGNDLLKATLQLNGYRIKIEPLGFNVSRMFVQAIVRDGGTYTAKNNGISEKMLMIPIERMPNDDVHYYFSAKANALLDALNTNILPEFCSYIDRWGGRRCKEYCEVSEWCPEGAKVNRVELKE